MRRRVGAKTPAAEGRFLTVPFACHIRPAGLVCTGKGLTLILFFVFSWIATPARAQSGRASRPDPERWAFAPSIIEQPVLRDMGEEGLALLYNMEYEAADSIFRRVEADYSGHPVGPFLRALVIWWRILPNLELGATENDKLFYAAMDQVVSWSEAILKRNPHNFDAMLFKGAALGFRGRLKSNRKQWLSAALDGRQTLDYIFKIAEADPTNADYQFGRGVYDYFASIIPERYPQVKPLMLFFPDADRERGLQNLNFTADQGHFIRTEAVYFLVQIHLFYEPNFMEARRRVRWLRNTYPDNAYFHVLEGRLYARWSQWERAIVVYRDVVRLHDAGQQGYSALLTTQALYNIGRYEMGNERHEEALRTFERVGAMSAGFPADTYFSVHALLRTGMIYDLQGRRDEARATYRRVLDMEDQEGSRDDARKYLRNAYVG